MGGESAGAEAAMAAAGHGERGRPGAPHEQMNIVIVGHVDHGKSTLVGRLLADTGSLPDGKLDHVRAICARQGKEFEYAFLLDALEAEQDQGITIDSARVFFRTAARDYIIIDAPGHIEFLKNMISGAARAEAAILLIDAHEGVRENSRRHGYVLGLLGIRQVTVLVNKMDLVGYDQAVFARIEAEYRAFLAECRTVPQRFIPISARDGDNVARHSARMPWYRGPTALEAVDLFHKAPPKQNQPLRFPVQDVYRFNRAGDDRRVIAGRLVAGRVAVGDAVVFSPSNKLSTIASIEAFAAPVAAAAEAPDCVGVTLSEQIYVQRGELCSHLDDRPQVATRFRANLVWLGRRALALGGEYKLKLTTCETTVRVAEIQSVLDASTLTTDRARAEVRRHEVAEVVLEAKRPVAFDLIDRFEHTARFVLVDAYDVAGGGIILEALGDTLAPLREEARLRDFEWVQGHVTQADRAERFGHEPVLVLLTGLAGVGKAAIARRLERLLFDRGDAVYLLDARNVYVGLDRDLAASMNRDELLRRYAEVAYLFLDAGQVVISTSNTFGLADHAAIRALIGGNHVLHVHVGAEPAGADLVVDAALDADAAAREIVTHLTQQGWLMSRPD